MAVARGPPRPRDALAAARLLLRSIFPPECPRPRCSGEAGGRHPPPPPGRAADTHWARKGSKSPPRAPPGQRLPAPLRPPFPARARRAPERPPARPAARPAGVAAGRGTALPGQRGGRGRQRGHTHRPSSQHGFIKYLKGTMTTVMDQVMQRNYTLKYRDEKEDKGTTRRIVIRPSQL
ncbi:unnamed protein product [Bubo scandiacus]